MNNTINDFMSFLFREEDFKLTPKKKLLLDSLEEIRGDSPLDFIEKYYVFLSPDKLQLFKSLGRLERAYNKEVEDDDWADDFYNTDEYFEIEEQLLEDLIKNINPYLIKYRKRTLSYMIDSGQGGEATLILDIDPFVENKQEQYKTKKDWVRIYHVTDRKNAKKILKFGLLPKAAAEGGESYEPRVYFYLKPPTPKDLKDVVIFQGKASTGLSGPRPSQQVKTVEDMVVFEFEIPVALYKIYKDPSTTKGYFVNKAIPAKYIVESTS